MTKTLGNSFSPHPTKASSCSVQRAFQRSVRLALHRWTRSLKQNNHPLAPLSSDLSIFIPKSRSLDNEFKKLKLLPQKSVFVTQDSNFKNISMELKDKKSKITLSNIRKNRGRAYIKRRDGSKMVKKKTKGPSLKGLSILEFKHNKELTNFFKLKREELHRLLEQKIKKQDPEFSMTSNSTGLTQDFPREDPNSTLKTLPKLLKDLNLKHFKELYKSSNSTPPQQDCPPLPSETLLATPLFKVFSVVRQEPSVNKRRNLSSRDSKGLHQMSRSLIRLLSNNTQDSFSLDSICTRIQVEKRKIYDLINILTSIRMIDRVSKGVYKWLGTASILAFLNALPRFEELASALKQEKSLGSMCYCFLSFMKSNLESSIENAAESLTKTPSQKKPVNSISFRSKIRRLYDISKILATVGLIKNLSENKKPIMKWVGPQNMLKVVKNISTSTEEIPMGTLDMRQMMEKLQTSLNNAVLTIPEAEMRRKRIESIDLGIVEKYFNNKDQGLILPRVSVVIPEL